MLIRVPEDHRTFSQEYFDYLGWAGKVGYCGELAFIRYFSGIFSTIQDMYFDQFDDTRDVYTTNNGIWNISQVEIKAQIRNILEQMFVIPNTPTQIAKCSNPDVLLCFCEWDIRTNLFSFYFCKNRIFIPSRFKDRKNIHIDKKNFTADHIDVYEDKFLIEKIKPAYEHLSDFANMRLRREII